MVILNEILSFILLIFIIVFSLNLRKGDQVKKDKKIITSKRRSFIKKAGLLTLGAAGATTIKAPYAYSAI